ncbi:hypothetical protein [uncultured Shewanella sp.]|uniref:hypothetical protein n=1 Tax=uncultured Shewanella sp. TaxID=173975 RepID=UPI00261ABFBF|nr:hypothetical protein [uncultured Shewanella sp.]
MSLESTLISLAENKLNELKSYVASPDQNEEQMKADVTTTFIELGQLTEFAHISDSGLTASSIDQLIEIESKKNALARTFSWMYV